MGERKRAIRYANGGKHFPIRRNQNAQALIEFVLILPILLILVVGALEFGRLWSTKTVLTNAAREGAYYMTMHTKTTTTNGVSTTTCDATCLSGTFDAAFNEAIDSGVTLVDSTKCLVGDVVCSIGEDPDPTISQYIGTVTTKTTVGDLVILGFLGTDNQITITSKVEMMAQ